MFRSSRPAGKIVPTKIVSYINVIPAVPTVPTVLEKGWPQADPRHIFLPDKMCPDHGAYTPSWVGTIGTYL
jgi:hypothetical protein